MSGEWLLLMNTLYNGVLLRFVSEMTDQQLGGVRQWGLAFASSAVAVLTYPNVLGVIGSFLVLLYALPTKRRWSALFLLFGSCLVGGLLTALQAYASRTGSMQWVWLAFAAFTLAYVLRMWRLRWRLEQTFIVDCEIWLAQQRIACIGFIDTGNVCTEPISGLPVHFVALDALRPHVSASLLAVMQGVQHDARYNVRQLYLSTVNGERVVTALQVEAIVVNGRHLRHHYVVLVEKRPVFQQSVDVILHCSVLPNT